MAGSASRLHRVLAAAALVLLLATSRLAWFADRSMRTLGPAGWVHCHDLPCDVEPDHLPAGLGPLGLLTSLSAIAAAGLTCLCLFGRARPARGMLAVAICLACGVSFWTVAALGHGLGRTFHDAEAGARTAPPAALVFVLSAIFLLCALSALRGTRRRQQIGSARPRGRAPVPGGGMRIHTGRAGCINGCGTALGGNDKRDNAVQLLEVEGHADLMAAGDSLHCECHPGTPSPRAAARMTVHPDRAIARCENHERAEAPATRRAVCNALSTMRVQHSALARPWRLEPRPPIVVASSDDILRRWVSRIVWLCGGEPCAATDLPSALYAVADDPSALVITHRFDGLTAERFVAFVRSAGSHVPAIVLGDFVERPTSGRGASLAPFLLLPDPLDAAALRDALRAAAFARPPAASARPANAPAR